MGGAEENGVVGTQDFDGIAGHGAASRGEDLPNDFPSASALGEQAGEVPTSLRNLSGDYNRLRIILLRLLLQIMFLNPVHQKESNVDPIM